ncbi:hypothetical protein ACO0SA_000293 [Hanseniaspora valbyensis]
MTNGILSDYFYKNKNSKSKISLNIEKLITNPENGSSTDYKLFVFPLYAILFFFYTVDFQKGTSNAYLESISKAINGQGIDFFLSDSKGKSPLLFFTNYKLIQIFNKICTIFPFNDFKVFDVEGITKFNISFNNILFGIFLLTLGKYLSSRSIQRKLILIVQFSLFYFIKKQFLEQESTGLLNADLIFNNLAIGSLFHLNKYIKRQVSDLKNVLITSLILGALIAVKPTSLAAVLVYMWLILYWIWQVISIYQFDLSISTINLFVYQIIFKVSLMVTVSLAVYYQITSLFLINFEYNENNFDLSQLSAISKNTFNSLKNYDGNMLGVVKEVRYMDSVLIRHADSLGGYLHSHDSDLQTGSGQQQVTVFDQQDMMNEWTILPGDFNLRKGYLSGNNTDYEVVKRSHNIVLKHKITGKYLYVHPDFRGPVSEKEKAHEVTCKEFDALNEDDASFKFRIDYPFKAENSNLQLIDNEFELASILTSGCRMLSHMDRLPPWGYFQQEVICMEMATHDRTQFIIEKITETTKESLAKVEYRELKNVKWLDLIKEYLIKSWKKEIYDDDLKVKIDAHTNKLVLQPIKESIFKYSELSMLHAITIATIILSLISMLIKAIMIAPFEGNVNQFKNIENFKAKQFRYFTNLLILLVGLVVFSFSLIKLNSSTCLTENAYQFGITLQVLIVAEYINCFI